MFIWRNPKLYDEISVVAVRAARLPPDAGFKDRQIFVVKYSIRYFNWPFRKAVGTCKSSWLNGGVAVCGRGGGRASGASSPDGRVQGATKLAVKWILQVKTVEFLRSTTWNYGGKQYEIQQIILFFFRKFVISVRGGHFEFSPLTQKKKNYAIVVEHLLAETVPVITSRSYKQGSLLVTARAPPPKQRQLRRWVTVISKVA